LEFRRFVNLCYPGQTFDMAVPARAHAGRMSAAGLAATIAAFHDLHQELHAYPARDEEPAVPSRRGQTPRRPPPLELGESAPADAPLERALLARRPAWFDGRFVDTPVYDGDRIRVGHEIRGPAIVEERFTTILVPPGWRAALDRSSNYEIARG